MIQISFDTPIRVHFIGIGGISMSAIAELLHRKGFTITGSDHQHSHVADHLERLGVRIQYENRAENISPDTDLIVYTAAIREDNPELAAARASGIPMLTRAQLLGQIMLHYKDAIGVAGTHGKTTTTSMLSMILLEAGFDPTILVGGELADIEGNLRMGNSEHFVMEACEYTNSFLNFNPAHEIILNIEEDHLDFFHDITDIRNSFRKFISLIPAGNHLVVNSEIERLDELTDGLLCNVITYGLETEHCGRDSGKGSFDYTAANISFDEDGHGSFDLFCRCKKEDKTEFLGRIILSIGGLHNVSNALSAIAMAHSLGASYDSCKAGIADFRGTKRRFERKGQIGEVTIIDDYAHHPTEIRATLTAARACKPKRIVCVFQPHTYSRTKAFLNEFAEALSLADVIVLTDIYSARETNPGDISSLDLLARLSEKGKDVYHFSSFDEIETFLLQKCLPNDMLITMGAGDVVNIGENLLGN